MKNYLSVHSTLAFRFWNRVESCGTYCVFSSVMAAGVLMFVGIICAEISGDAGSSFDCGALALLFALTGGFVGAILQGIAQNRMDALEMPEREIARRNFHSFICARDRAELIGCDVVKLCAGLDTVNATAALNAYSVASGEFAR